MTLPQTDILFENHGLGLDSEEAMAAIAMQLNAIEPGAGTETTEKTDAAQTALQTLTTADPSLWVEMLIGMTILTIGSFLFSKHLKKKKMVERPSSLVIN